VARVRRFGLSALGSRLWAIGGAAFFTVAILSSASSTRAAAPEDELPECTACHDLSEVTKFHGYYDRKQWRDIVVTMMDYGAPVDEKQVDILADYLAQHLGKK
jgi:hypothetical protein